MIYLSAAGKAVISVVVLFLLTKMMGRRQVSQLSLFDYVNGISFGSIAAEIAISKDDEDVLIGIVAMAIYTAVALIFDFLSNRSIHLRRFFEGVPIVLIENGKIYEKNFARAKIDINEFLMSCRKEGYFDLSAVQTAIFEPNGMISVLKKQNAQPDGVKSVPAVAVLDGKIMENNVENVGFSREYVENMLTARGYSLPDVFFASLKDDGTLDVFTKTGVFPKDKLE